MNIILVVFDSLRKDCMGAYGAPPWGKVQTPHFDAFAEESMIWTRAYPESLPTLPTRRALYTGQRVYPFIKGDFRIKGDFVGAPGWGPIPEEQPTLAEMLHDAGYRTGLIADVYHMFKPSKNYARGFDQWTFLRGQETDPARSGPKLTQEELDFWLPRDMQNEWSVRFIQQCIMNMHDRRHEEDYFAPRVLKEAARWLEENRDTRPFFLTVESFDPHEPWLVPDYYRKMYTKEEGHEQVKSGYADVSQMAPGLLQRTQANYSGLVTLCDRWFGFFMDSLRVLGLLDKTMVVFTADHGHSIGDRNYMGKRGYPSAPEVYDIPLLVRLPDGEEAGTVNDDFVQHTDISATILESAGIMPDQDLDGVSLFSADAHDRDHVTVGWGSTPTVITKKWWFNCKADGTGVILHDLESDGDAFAANVAPEHPSVVDDLFETAKRDAGGAFPDWLVALAKEQADAPGCSDLAARA